MDKMKDIFTRFFLEEKNFKGKEETLDEFLNSFTSQELLLFITYYCLKNHHKMNEYETLNKKELISFIKKNLEAILVELLYIFTLNDLEYLKVILANKGKYLDSANQDISFHFIAILKKYSIAKIEYNKKNHNIKVYMPEEYYQIFAKLVNDKEVINTIKTNEEVFNNVLAILSAYGILTISKIFKIYNTKFAEIDQSKLFNIIVYKSSAEEFNLILYKKDALMAEHDFNDKNIIDFYENLEGKYRLYSKEEYQKMADLSYIDSFPQYITLVKYLEEEYGCDKKALNYFKEMYIYDYIFTAQISSKDADNNFLHNIKDFIAEDDAELNNILGMLKEVFKVYPKWQKKGNI